MPTDILGAVVGLALTLMILSYLLGDNPLCLEVADTCLDGHLWTSCAALADACDTVQPNPPDCYDLVVACTCWTSELGSVD